MILPCPFCGETPAVKWGKVACRNPKCLVEVKIKTWYEPGYNEAAIADWNKRVDVQPNAAYFQTVRERDVL